MQEVRPRRLHGCTRPLGNFQIGAWVGLGLLLGTFCLGLPALSPAVAGVSIALFGLAWMVTIGAKIIASVTDPADPALKDPEADRNVKDTKGKNPLDQNTYCFRCDASVKPNSKHCYECEKCVPDFDHHCRWLNNCVSDRNYKSFFILLITAVGEILVCGCYTVYVFVAFFADVDAGNGMVDAYGDGGAVAVLVFLGLMVPILFIALYLTGDLLVEHFYLQYRGLSTYDLILIKRNAMIMGMPVPGLKLDLTNWCKRGCKAEIDEDAEEEKKKQKKSAAVAVTPSKETNAPRSVPSRAWGGNDDDTDSQRVATPVARNSPRINPLETPTAQVKDKDHSHSHSHSNQNTTSEEGEAIDVGRRTAETLSTTSPAHHPEAIGVGPLSHAADSLAGVITAATPEGGAPPATPEHQVLPTPPGLSWSMESKLNHNKKKLPPISIPDKAGDASTIHSNQSSPHSNRSDPNDDQSKTPLTASRRAKPRPMEVPRLPHIGGSMGSTSRQVPVVQDATGLMCTPRTQDIDVDHEGNITARGNRSTIHTARTNASNASAPHAPYTPNIYSPRYTNDSPLK